MEFMHSEYTQYMCAYRTSHVVVFFNLIVAKEAPLKMRQTRISVTPSGGGKLFLTPKHMQKNILTSSLNIEKCSLC
jgi:hypothetical protein